MDGLIYIVCILMIVLLASVLNTTVNVQIELCTKSLDLAWKVLRVRALRPSRPRDVPASFGKTTAQLETGYQTGDLLIDYWKKVRSDGVVCESFRLSFLGEEDETIIKMEDEELQGWHKGAPHLQERMTEARFFAQCILGRIQSAQRNSDSV